MGKPLRPCTRSLARRAKALRWGPPAEGPLRGHISCNVFSLDGKNRCRDLENVRKTEADAVAYFRCMERERYWSDRKDIS